MPRIARHIEENGYYHVISRSINQTWVLRDPEDFARLRRLIREAKDKFPTRLFHYALMNTHFHLVVQAITKDLLAQHLAYVKWHYTQWMRKKYRWRGPLWRERYKSLPIEDETYLAACGLYVECNPVQRPRAPARAPITGPATGWPCGRCPVCRVNSHRRFHLVQITSQQPPTPDACPWGDCHFALSTGTLTDIEW